MNCIAPNEIQEGDLLAYIDGAASRKVKAHLKRCKYCSALVADVRETQYLVLNSMYRASCPSIDTLSDYQSNLLPAHERLVIGLHLKQCPHCSRELKELASLDIEKSSQWEEFRRGLRTVIDAFRLQPSTEVRGLQSVRGGEPVAMLYQAKGLDIFLGSHQDGMQWQLNGRAARGGQAAQELVGHEAWLVRAGTPLSQITIDDLGEFLFDQLSPGVYDLWLAGDDADIVIKQVIVGSPGREK